MPKFNGKASSELSIADVERLAGLRKTGTGNGRRMEKD